MTNWADIFRGITMDQRYLAGVKWGSPRPGHREGSIAAHIDELEANIVQLVKYNIVKNGSDEFWRLGILIHVHDTFKGTARRGASIEDPDSHGSLAQKFLAEYTTDKELLHITKYHDEGYALWKQYESRGHYDEQRLNRNVLHSPIRDMNLFLLFTLIDGSTGSKDKSRIAWFVREIDFESGGAYDLERVEEALMVLGIIETGV